MVYFIDNNNKINWGEKVEIMDYIIQNRLILIPVLYIIGIFIKRTQFIKDKYIPLLLLPFGIFFSILMGGETIINDIIQGVLVTGATVMGDQMIKQMQKEE